MTDQVNNLLLKLKQRHVELGDKPGKLLARQLKSDQASRAINSIKSKTGTLLTNPVDVNHRFSEFYCALYSSKHNVSQSNLKVFFDSLSLPRLSSAARQSLDSDFTLQEVIAAIKSFPSGKAAGPDGFSSEFYKKFFDILAPLLLRMMHNSKNDKKNCQKPFMKPTSLLF